MRRDFAFVIVAGAGAFFSERGEAANVTVGGFIDLHAGYGSNPFFSIQSLGASPTVGTTVNATVTRQTMRNHTEITAEADLDHFIKHYGTEQNYSATLRHNQQISQRVAVSGNVKYENDINASPSYSTRFSDLVTQSDLLTVGQRTKRLSGGGDVSWEPNDRNMFQGGLNASHASFGGGANDYTTYGGSLGYLHTFTSHTKLGVQASANQVYSTGNPNSQSYSFGLQLIQDLGPRWHFEGGTSLLAQNTLGHLSKTLGFNGSLCGNYTRIVVCATGSRVGAPSGIGGLRTDTQGGGRVNYKISTRSSVNVSATYDVSTSAGDVIPIPAQKYYDAAVAYRRELTPHLLLGASGRAQRRDYGTLLSPDGTKVNSYSATLNLVWNFGRKT